MLHEGEEIRRFFSGFGSRKDEKDSKHEIEIKLRLKLAADFVRFEGWVLGWTMADIVEGSNFGKNIKIKQFSKIIPPNCNNVNTARLVPLKDSKRNEVA